LVVNAKWGSKSVPNLFEGTFDDVTPEWFWTVATTVVSFYPFFGLIFQANHNDN